MKYVYGTVVAAAAVASAAAAATEAESSNPLLETTLDFLARASSTSEVLTLNLTNLLILLALKAVLIGAGFVSLGATARSADSGPVVKQSDLTGGMCFMMYTAGDVEKLSCVQRSACEDPKTATDYLTAAKMWYKMHKMMKVVPFTDKYFNIMNAVQDATEHSLGGGDCSHFKW